MKNEYMKKLVAIFNGNEKVVAEDVEVNDSKSSPKPFLNIPSELFPYRVQVPLVLGPYGFDVTIILLSF